MRQIPALLTAVLLSVTPLMAQADFEFRANKPGVLPPGQGGTPPGQTPLSVSISVNPAVNDTTAYQGGESFANLATPAPMLAAFGEFDGRFFDDYNGSITVVGGHPPYSYSWETAAAAPITWVEGVGYEIQFAQQTTGLIGVRSSNTYPTDCVIDDYYNWGFLFLGYVCDEQGPQQTATATNPFLQGWLEQDRGRDVPAYFELRLVVTDNQNNQAVSNTLPFVAIGDYWRPD